jgi:hypothetical protein
MAMVASAGSHQPRGWKALLRIELGWRHGPSSGSFLRPEARVVVVHVGWPLSPLVHLLTRFIVVRPPNMHAVGKGEVDPPFLVSCRGEPITPGFKAKTRCSSYVCPGSSCHIYDQNVNTENQCLYYINIITWDIIFTQKTISTLSSSSSGMHQSHRQPTGGNASF